MDCERYRNFDSSGSDLDSSPDTSKSVPAILNRKRKVDLAAHEDMKHFDEDVVVLSSDDDSNHDDSENYHGKLSKPDTKGIVPKTSRMPLSTLQTRNQIQINPSERSSTSKGIVFKKGQPSNPMKKPKLRESWAKFREFTLNLPKSESRSKAPFPSLKWADRQEMWDLVCKKERGMYQKKTSQEILSQHPAILPQMRTILLDWMTEVCEVYKQHRETYYLAVDFIDRYLSSTRDLPKGRLQLLGVTCLFISSKIEEIYPPKLSEFAYVTDGACTDEEILKMELVILKELNWGLSPMTPHAWIKIYMQVSYCDHRHDMNDSFVLPQFSGLPFSRVMQLMDLATLDMGSLSFTNSILATAAMCHLQGRELALAASGYSWSNVAQCYLWMAPFVQVLKEDVTLQQQNRTFYNIPMDDQHNIQSHSVEIATLEKAQQLSQTQVMESPDVSRITSASSVLVEMTPPASSSDVQMKNRFVADTPTSSQTSKDTLSAFPTPQSPEEKRKKKLPNILLK